MNAEVFAKGIEKYKLLTGLLGKNVKDLNDYGCPKIQNLVGEGKANSLCICSRYPLRHKTRLHCAESKAKSMENGLCNFCKFLYVFFVFVFITNLIPSSQHNFFDSIHFQKLSLQNRRLN